SRGGGPGIRRKKRRGFSSRELLRGFDLLGGGAFHPLPARATRPGPRSPPRLTRSLRALRRAPAGPLRPWAPYFPGGLLVMRAERGFALFLPIDVAEAPGSTQPHLSGPTVVQDLPRKLAEVCQHMLTRRIPGRKPRRRPRSADGVCEAAKCCAFVSY
ncbi:unnamed protein product, partial [Amoebophrya sp. A120]